MKFGLVLTLLCCSLMSFAQQDVSVFEKKDGNKNIVFARNIGKVPYVVSLVINAKGMDVTPGIKVDAVVPAGHIKELATLTPRPGESWSYGYDVSFMQHTGDLDMPVTSSGNSEQKYESMPSPAKLSEARIIVYTKPGCGRCTAVKKGLNDRGVSYEEVDVNSSSPEVSNMWKQLRDGGFSGNSVTMPVVRLDGKYHYNIKDLNGFVAGIK